ncbi:hypothetical protein MNBD_GAMMA14-1346 [hydrothermal vent metagenome]|uniref:Uncharacterized protein n=1 Tax=hydrothermal vent metagenome TaxID=652676 RepID=A0A3B0Z5E3_9ZZZZ
MKKSRYDSSTEVLQDEAHVWFVTPESVCDPVILQRCHALLDAQERRQFARFFHADDSHRYLISHALVRSVLSYYADVAPSSWCFEKGQHGRPEIVSDSLPHLRFNLTHTTGMAACIVTLNDDCGIDAEQLCIRSNAQGVAERMFSALELKQLMRYEGRAFLEYFYECWTLREAYVKARGIGISFPTRQLTFNREGSQISIRFDAQINDSGSHWHFQLIRPNSTHLTAIALRHSGKLNKRIRTHPFDFTE